MSEQYYVIKREACEACRMNDWFGDCDVRDCKGGYVETQIPLVDALRELKVQVSSVPDGVWLGFTPPSRTI